MAVMRILIDGHTFEARSDDSVAAVAKRQQDWLLSDDSGGTGSARPANRAMFDAATAAVVLGFKGE